MRVITLEWYVAGVMSCRKKRNRSKLNSGRLEYDNDGDNKPL